MKTLPIRCRPGDTRPIRAIANEPAAAEENNKPDDEQKRRDPCPTLRFFEDARGKYPESWVDLLAVLNETAKNGPPQNKSKFNSLGDGLYEFKSWRLRLVCFFDDGSLIICTHGFFKQTEGLPDNERTKALKAQTSYFEAKKRNAIEHVQPNPQ